MNCFYHQDRVAVAICKSCSRGLCQECASDIENGLACRGRCEDRAKMINNIIDSNQQVRKVANIQLKLYGQTTMLLGLVFIGFGGWMVYAEGWAFGLFFSFFGLILIWRGKITYNRSSRYP